LPGYRVPPPSAAEGIAWPASFGTRFTIFCDIEEEFDWRRPLSRDARSTAAMAAFPAAHRRFADAGVGLTCMVDHPVASDPAAAEMLARAVEDRRSAIGAQLHAWVTPPFDENVTPANSYAGNLPRALEAAKIDALTETIEVATGIRPLAFRSGRYGIGPATLALLAERGYRLDGSVRARYDYRADGGPDFRAIGNAAFRRAGLIELPFSTTFTGRLRQPALYAAAARVPHGPGLLARSGLVSRVSLTPEDMPIGEALRAVEVAVQEGERLLAFSFHSPSLAPGNTPYVRDGADLVAFWRWWDLMLSRLAKLGVAYASLADILAAADHSPG
jgi:hypothetical protein